jgi:hypothetical protein
MTSLPPFFGFTANALVQITNFGSGTTTDFDGASSFNGISTGNVVSISAVYFGTTITPAFSAATVRKH